MSFRFTVENSEKNMQNAAAALPVIFLSVDLITIRIETKFTSVSSSRYTQKRNLNKRNEIKLKESILHYITKTKVNARSHTNTHAGMHIRTHEHLHTSTNTQTYVRTCTRVHIYTHTHTHIKLLSGWHTYIRKIFLPAPVAQSVECPLRRTGGHGFHPGPRHTKVVKSGASCTSLDTQTYRVELGLIDLVTECGIMSGVFGEASNWAPCFNQTPSLYDWKIIESDIWRNRYEPRHDKTNQMSVRPAKTQISLGIRWSESSLGAQSLCWFCHVAAHIANKTFSVIQAFNTKLWSRYTFSRSVWSWVGGWIRVYSV